MSVMQEPLVKTRPTRIAVDLADGYARLSTLDQGYHAGGRLMLTDGSFIRIGLLGVHMPLLGGDRAEIQVRVGKGVVLEVIEPSGMIAYNAEGKRSEYHLSIVVEETGMLIWRGAEFIAAEGSNAWRTVNINLKKNTRALFKEEVVLGRTGESSIYLNNRMRATLMGKELLVEELSITPLIRRLPGIIEQAKVVSTVAALGFRPFQMEEKDTHRLDLSGLGAIYRAIADAGHLAEDKVIPIFNQWEKEILNISKTEKQ